MFAMILTRVFIVKASTLGYHEIKGGFHMALQGIAHIRRP